MIDREIRRAANAEAVALAAASLRKTLAAIEVHRRAAQSPETDPGFADREAMGRSLVATFEFCGQLHMEIGSLARLNGLLLKAHTTGVATGLQGPPSGRHRAPDSLIVQGAKGALAGIMAARRTLRGETKQQAAGWVAKHVPPELGRTLSAKPITASIVTAWFDRYGGDHGESGFARDRFAVALAQAGPSPTDAQLKAMIRTLGPLSQMPSR